MKEGAKCPIFSCAAPKFGWPEATPLINDGIINYLPSWVWLNVYLHRKAGHDHKRELVYRNSWQFRDWIVFLAILASKQPNCSKIWKRRGAQLDSWIIRYISLWFVYLTQAGWGCSSTSSTPPGLTNSSQFLKLGEFLHFFNLRSHIVYKPNIFSEMLSSYIH